MLYYNYLLYLLFLTDSNCFRAEALEQSFVLLLQLNYYISCKGSKG